MKERRNLRHDRLSVTLMARYCLEEQKNFWNDCTITDVSPHGAALTLRTSERIDKGTMLFLEIVASKTKVPAVVEGIVRWVKSDTKDFSVGIEAASKTDADKFSELFVSALEL